MTVDAAYERVVNTMFDSLKQMAKMEGEGEDKGQLNYHVILIGQISPKAQIIMIYYTDLLIENMHHFVAETSQMEIGSVAGFVKKAEGIYDENLSAYVKIILRRPFAKIIVRVFLKLTVDIELL